MVSHCYVWHCKRNSLDAAQYCRQDLMEHTSSGFCWVVLSCWQKDVRIDLHYNLHCRRSGLIELLYGGVALSCVVVTVWTHQLLPWVAGKQSRKDTTVWYGLEPVSPCIAKKLPEQMFLIGLFLCRRTNGLFRDCFRFFILKTLEVVAVLKLRKSGSLDRRIP